MKMLCWMAVCAMACAARGVEFDLGAGKSVDLPVADKGAMRLRVRARLAIPEGEGGFVHALRIAVDGKPLAAKPVNVGEKVYDAKEDRIAESGIDRWDAEKGAWAVREDADFIAYNFPESLNGRWHWYNTSVARDEWSNEYFDYVFDLPAGAKSVRIENAAAEGRSLRGEATVYAKPAYPVFFQRPAGEHIFRFTQPRPEESGLEKLTAYACRGERATLVLSVRTDRAERWTWTVDGLGGADIRPLGYTKWQAKRKDWITAKVMWFRFGTAESFDMPDLLTADDAWSVGADEASSLWIMYDVPTNAPAGTIRGSIALTGSSGAERRIPIEIEVPGFDLPDTGRMYGTWSTSFPNVSDMQGTRLQAEDLRAHGINTLFYGGNHVGVGKGGEPGLSLFDREIKVFKEYGFNERMFIFYIGDPLFYAINMQVQREEVEDFRANERKRWQREQAAEAKGDDEIDIDDGADLDDQLESAMKHMLDRSNSRNKASKLGKAEYAITNRFWRPKAKVFFNAVGKAIEKAGYKPYFMPMDEPENGYMKKFLEFSRFMKEETPYEIAANVQVPNYYRYRDLIGFNICNGLAPRKAVKDAKGNVVVPAEWVSENCVALYRQVRSFDNHGDRFFYGYRNEIGGLRGCWGWAYDFNRSPFYSVGRPVREKDGRCGTTTGWESIRMGIWDSRYAAALDALSPGEGTRLATELARKGCQTVTELQAIRDAIYARIRELKGAK